MSKSAKPKPGCYRGPPLQALARLRLQAAADDEDTEDRVETNQDEDEQEDIVPSPDGDNVDNVDNEEETSGEDDPRLDEGPSMDPEEGDDISLAEDAEDAFTLEDVITCFLRANPTPTDEQVHAFAELMGLTYEDFEAEVFRKFGEVVRQNVQLTPSELDDEDQDSDSFDVDNPGDGVEDDDLDIDEDSSDETELDASDDLDVQDDIDMFLVAYTLFNPQPSDDQIHQLGFVVNLTQDQVEQRIYRMLGTFLKMGGGADIQETEGNEDSTDVEDTSDEEKSTEDSNELDKSDKDEA
jgi:hypothetical protein